MFFMNRFNAAAPKATRTIAEGRSSRRRRASLRLETLEDRDLKTGISLEYGTIAIQGAEGVSNSAHVWRSDDGVYASLNGQVTRFSASEVYGVSFKSDSGGGDTFVNDTDLNSLTYGYGGGNTFYGGSSFNVAYLYGNNNRFDARGAGSYVFSYDGPQDSVAQYGNTYTYSYSTALFYFI